MIATNLSEKNRKMLEQLIDSVVDRPSSIRKEHFVGSVWSGFITSCTNLGAHIKPQVFHDVESVADAAMSHDPGSQSENDRACELLSRRMLAGG